MPNLIEWLDSVSSSGKAYDIDDPEIIKDYAPFAINRGLSQNMDTVLLANEMNKLPFIDKALQYKFLFHSVTKKRRYGKWTKAEVVSNQEDIDAVSDFFQVNKERAVEYLSLLIPTQLTLIKQRMDVGGCDIPKGRKKK